MKAEDKNLLTEAVSTLCMGKDFILILVDTNLFRFYGLNLCLYI